MTRLYYTDPLLTSFDATVVSCDPHEDRFSVLLDRTAFYPTSGGQPFDAGTIGGADVLDVYEREDDHQIVHVVDRPLVVGNAVAGKIDWKRRLDHMQQHTGQHLLSAAFDRLFSVRTVSFHMGSDASTIDLARETTAEEITCAERLANTVVWEDRTVTVRFVAADSAAALPLRKESSRTGELRLVEIPEFDLSACGGTHVPATGMVGMVAVTAWERFKGGTRVSFGCGGRALRSHAELRDIVTRASRSLATSAADLPTRIDRLQSEVKTTSKAIEQLAGELAQFRAVALRQTAELVNGVRLVSLSETSGDAPHLKRLAWAIVSEPGLAAVVIGAGEPTPLVAARSADVAWDAAAFVKQAADRFGGRGGGRPEMAQGGVLAAAEAIVTFARQSLAAAGTVNRGGGTQ
jgi:alanyl-tRNA synthetase